MCVMCAPSELNKLLHTHGTRRGREKVDIAVACQWAAYRRLGIRARLCDRELCDKCDSFSLARYYVYKTAPRG